jgi:hypothetical protein
MYLRNVKQMIRQGSPSFDERAFGFANLADLLRAAHKDGAVRVERDRQGVIRVFQANGAAPAPASTPSRVAPPTGDVDGNRADFGAPHEDLDAPDDDAMPVAAAAAEVGVPVLAIEDAGDEVGTAAGEPAAAAAPRPRRRRPRSTTATPRASRARKAR